MQPVKLTILGDFVDCQIYRGRLYLWTFEGSLKVYMWKDLIQSLSNGGRDDLPLKFCFLDGNYLYKSDLVELFHDSDFKRMLIDKFSLLSKQHYELTENQADKFLFGEQGNPGEALTTDTEIYSSNLYYITEKGLFSTTAHRGNKKYPVSTKPKKHWDCDLLSIKANRYPQLALSGGDEGLFELDISAEFRSGSNKKEPVLISKKHSSFANYTFWSIYNSSLVDNSYMALFDLKEVESEIISPFDYKRTKYKREFKGEINETQIFDEKNKGRHLSWGVDDKIYKATENGFEIVRFRNNPKLDQGEEHFNRIQNVDLHPWKGKVIGGGTSYYGTIVECENALVVMLSSGDIETIQGPITRWRIYPRSMNYQNQLHVIKDDRIEIYSFNQDYFLDQEDKLLGLEFKPQRTWQDRTF